MSTSELILYATPRGPLADAIETVFQAIDARQSTTAQTYPPHCTLTGFFHRPPHMVDQVIADVDATAAGVTQAVDVVQIRHTESWIGLELQSADLLERTQRFVDRHEVRPGDDPIRIKDWLHLSLAYGIDDLNDVAELTHNLDPALDVEWEVGLWQRDAGNKWKRLTPQIFVR